MIAWLLKFQKVIAYGLLAGIVIGSFLPPKDVNALHLPGNDKFIHASAYMLLTFAFLFSYRRKQVVTWWRVVVSLWVMGALIEVFQPIVSPGRERDVLDLCANSGGIAFGVLLMLLFQKFRYSSNLDKPAE
ncbi:MAG: VanZ family protein [Pseudomonadota bacterium]